MPSVCGTHTDTTGKHRKFSLTPPGYSVSTEKYKFKKNKPVSTLSGRAALGTADGVFSTKPPPARCELLPRKKRAESKKNKKNNVMITN